MLSNIKISQKDRSDIGDTSTLISFLAPRRFTKTHQLQSIKLILRWELYDATCIVLVLMSP